VQHLGIHHNIHGFNEKDKYCPVEYLKYNIPVNYFNAQYKPLKANISLADDRSPLQLIRRGASRYSNSKFKLL